MVQIPIVDLEPFLATGRDVVACRTIRDAMEELGLLIVRDPRIPPHLPNIYREMMCNVFRLPEDVKKKYVMPPLPDGRQIYENGWRPPETEKPRRRTEVLDKIPPDMMPHEPPPLDIKERWMYPIGPRLSETEFPMLDFSKGIAPAEIREWSYLSAAWGKVMYRAMMIFAEMLALGFEEPPDLFTSLLKYGPNRLAPTGLDLSKYGKPGTVAAAFHNDLSCLTMHGRANAPGLWAWTRCWERFPVSMPDDACLLVQSGRALEHLTAGRTLRGYHEVVIGEEAQPFIRETAERGEIPWRVSTTAFFNIHTGAWLEPIGRFAREPQAAKYFEQRIKNGDRMMETLLRKAVQSR